MWGGGVKCTDGVAKFYLIIVLARFQGWWIGGCQRDEFSIDFVFVQIEIAWSGTRYDTIPHRYTALVNVLIRTR